MGLLDELRDDQGRPTQCQFCTWAASRTSAERKEWDDAFADRSLTATSLFRAARKRGYEGGSSSPDSHRKNGHRLVDRS